MNGLFKTKKARTLYFKMALKQIANDIRYVDSQLRSTNAAANKVLGDNAKYALSYIKSASHFTLFAETREIESKILDIVFEQVYAYMVNSDYARVKYGQLFSELYSARNSPVLSYKRQSLSYLENILK